MVKTLASLGLGALLTLLLYSMLHYAVREPPPHKTALTEFGAISIVSVRKERSLQTKERRLKPPPKKPKQIEALRTLSQSSAPSSFPLSFEMPRFSLAGFKGNGASLLPPSPLLSEALRGLKPSIYSAPRYPYRARAAGIEGSVELEFTITENGTVRDIELIRATPPNYFERAAIAAVSRWKFKPHYEGDRALRRRAVQVITFKLEKR